MNNGTVKWFNEAKGFGFISNDNGGDALFRHPGRWVQIPARRPEGYIRHGDRPQKQPQASGSERLLRLIDKASKKAAHSGGTHKTA